MGVILILASSVSAFLLGMFACWFIAEIAFSRSSIRTLKVLVMIGFSVCVGIPLYALVLLGLLSVFVALAFHAALGAVYLTFASFGFAGGEVEWFALILIVVTLIALWFPAIKAVRERPHSIPSITETARQTLPG